jgi:hypothetical protein
VEEEGAAAEVDAGEEEDNVAVNTPLEAPHLPF